MTREDIVSKTKEILSEEFEVAEDLIVDDAELQATLELDSLDYVDLVVIIEENFGFKVEQADFTEIKTFSDFYDYVQTKVN
ncbi:MAG TPA: acyl carrier protein [Flavobacteriales bacterium]|jgi:acyl carrier protein|nr:acyl carrier protein [Crocinitomicaceae bacterium]HAE29798.1 acyl carrier protein [Flavobacteriales bacterium]|tara:strand:+ start:19 stop:261 length:243 start_codon:yes stop_codon:yes gene_type:complete